jgi:hypothetical protein
MEDETAGRNEEEALAAILDPSGAHPVNNLFVVMEVGPGMAFYQLAPLIRESLDQAHGFFRNRSPNI